MNSYQLYKLIILIVYEKKLELNININQKFYIFIVELILLNLIFLNLRNFTYINIYLWKLYYYLVYQKHMLFLVQL